MNLFLQANVNMNSFGTVVDSTAFGILMPHFNITKSTF